MSFVSALKGAFFKTPAVSFTSKQERQKALIQVLKDQRWDLERRLHRIKERQSDEISDLTGEHVFTGSMSGDMYPPVKRHAGKGRYRALPGSRGPATPPARP